MTPSGWFNRDQTFGIDENDTTYYYDGLRIKNFFWFQFGVGWVTLYFLTSYVPMREDYDFEDRISRSLERAELAKKMKADKKAKAERDREDKERLLEKKRVAAEKEKAAA